ncbi:gamma-glutamyl-gamma-aminobutyrate hydrolase family protein [Candidatus Binatia bacterium]|nr:gamma-glutamyl-gamma-aminobutyrate hydrolase family protein [Candidatus Binatia bacterium]
MPRPRRIGVTMRVVPGGDAPVRDVARAPRDASLHDPRAPRDAPSRDPRAPRDLFPDDWRATLAAILPDAAWWPLPNAGDAAVQRFAELRLDALVLAGGNDLGSCPRRDHTERSLLLHCAARGIPVLGVCRGLQLVQRVFGGAIARAPQAHDAGRAHGIAVIDARARRLLGAERFTAPSYHRFGVPAGALAPALDAWAISDDGWVEMLAHARLAIVAVQWHPERPLPCPEVARRLLRGFADAC